MCLAGIRHYLRNNAMEKMGSSIQTIHEVYGRLAGSINDKSPQNLGSLKNVDDSPRRISSDKVLRLEEMLPAITKILSSVRNFFFMSHKKFIGNMLNCRCWIFRISVTIAIT